MNKDPAEVSFSDFYPQRFALNYDPPMISKSGPINFVSPIVLEYLVPSTGKLYHHKMKMRRLNGSSTVKEAMNYLHKRHPLYFATDKIDEV